MPKWLPTVIVALLAVATVVLAFAGHESDRRPLGTSLNINIGTPTATSTPDPGTFNVGVTAGTCDSTPTRLSTPVAAASVPAGSLACTFDQAWDVMIDSDRAVIKAGTYTFQRITGNRTANTYLVGEGDGDDVLIGNSVYQDSVGCTSSWSAFCADGNFMVLENVTTLVSDPGPGGGLNIGGANVTVRDFHTRGAVESGSPSTSTGYFWASSIGIWGNGFTFDGGSIGRTDVVEESHCYNAAIEPIWFQGGDNATIQYVTMGRYLTIERSGAEPQGVCGVDNKPHVETIRFEDSDTITIRGVTFSGPSDAGSGHVYTSSDADDIVWVNNIFEDRGLATPWITTSAGTPSNWTWLYNSFLDDGGVVGGIGGTQVYVGNLGYGPGCGTTDVKNVYAGSGSCGTSTYIGATAFGLDADNHVQAGSPAIDAAETPGASDYCTGADVASIDIDGDSRPFGGTGPCTAGADEPTS